MSKIYFAALLVMAPYAALATPAQTVNPHPTTNVTCIAQNTARNIFTGTGETIGEAQDQAIKYCNDAGNSKADCSIVSCK